MNGASTIARKLDMLAELLLREEVISDTGPLRKAANICRNESTNDEWVYRVDRLLFQPSSSYLKSKDPIKHTSISIELSIKIRGLLNPKEGQDPLTLLAMDIVIFADTQDGRKVTGAWHLDRHTEDLDNGVSKFLHPKYHFQFGGRELEEQVNGNYGSVLILDAPRIAYPPMDVFLGIDFILTNFFEIKEQAIREIGDYINIIKEMQKQLWKSYFTSLHGRWQPNSQHLLWKPFLIWPQMV